MFAIIKTGGKQYKVKENDVLTVEKLPQEQGTSVTFDQVLLVGDGDTATIGQPLVSGAKVTGEVVDQGKARKVMVIKFKNKIRYRRRKGHRQHQTKVKITGISAK